jgi:hypothetical protein
MDLKDVIGIRVRDVVCIGLTLDVMRFTAVLWPEPGLRAAVVGARGRESSADLIVFALEATVHVASTSSFEYSDTTGACCPALRLAGGRIETSLGSLQSHRSPKLATLASNPCHVTNASQRRRAKVASGPRSYTTLTRPRLVASLVIRRGGHQL